MLTLDDINVGDMLMPMSEEAEWETSSAGCHMTTTELYLHGPYAVTKVTRNFVWLRVPANDVQNFPTTLQYEIGNVKPADPDWRPPRRLGEKPEDTNEMTYIGIDHPGIQWLWDDLGKYATKQGYCPTYDALAAEIGIPGRIRTFTARAAIGGIEITSKVQARSQKEANAKFADSLRGKTVEAVPA